MFVFCLYVNFDIFPIVINHFHKKRKMVIGKKYDCEDVYEVQLNIRYHEREYVNRLECHDINIVDLI